MLQKIKEKVNELEEQIEQVQMVEIWVEKKASTIHELEKEVQKMLLINAQMNEMFLAYIREQGEKRKKRISRNIGDLGYPS